MKNSLLPFVLLFTHITFSQEIVGNTNFNVEDRIAIKNVIDAYGFYWDTNQLNHWLSLFTDDAIDAKVSATGETSNTKLKDNEAMYQARMDYFIKNNMQRRHMMANTLFLEQTAATASVEQYMTLITTNSKLNTEIVSPIFYKFKLKKINGIWKINYRQLILDKTLDLPLK